MGLLFASYHEDVPHSSSEKVRQLEHEVATLRAMIAAQPNAMKFARQEVITKLMSHGTYDPQTRVWSISDMALASLEK